MGSGLYFYVFLNANRYPPSDRVREQAPLDSTILYGDNLRVAGPVRISTVIFHSGF
jgi:hypothetical protein